MKDNFIPAALVGVCYLSLIGTAVLCYASYQLYKEECERVEVVTNLTLNPSQEACHITCKTKAVIGIKPDPGENFQGSVKLIGRGEKGASHCLCLAR